MTVAFRNVEGSADQPVDQWPFEALTAAIERGTLHDWLPLLAEIRGAPWGVVARQVEEYLDYESPYGVGPLLQRAISSARAGWEGEERRAVAARVQGLVDESGLSRQEFARAIGTSRSRLSTYCSGTVTPAATLLIRMQRVAERQRQAATVERSAHSPSHGRARLADT